MHPTPQPHNPPTSVTDGVFESLLAAIVRGDYPTNARLPPERDLAQQFGVGRSALREAVRRLTAWHLVEPRRGSGVVVLPRSEWSMEVLPAVFQARVAAANPADLRRSLLDLTDMLHLRRMVISEVLAMAAKRINGANVAEPNSNAPARSEPQPSPLDLTAARHQLDVAWAARHHPVRFVEEDFRMMRAVALAAHMMPAVWMLNSLAGVYLGIARQFSFGVPVTSNYLDAQLAMFAALEAGDGPQAAQIISDYLNQHDTTLITTLEAFVSP